MEVNDGKCLSKSKLRWKILSIAVRKGLHLSNSCNLNNSFTGFGLIKLTQVNNGVNKGDDDRIEGLNLKNEKTNNNLPLNKFGCLYKCTIDCDTESIELMIYLSTSKITIKELLIEPDNTGNIHIWPSEEILSYYVCKNKELFTDHPDIVVCELGGGMSCLAGMIVAINCRPQKVILTDGNIRCVENVKKIRAINHYRLGKTKVEVRKLKWALMEDYQDLCDQIDVILISDCLYYCESHNDLLDTIWSLLKENGLAVIVAPARGKSFRLFADLAKKRFHTEIMMVYDIEVYKIHRNLLESSNNDNNYNPDSHYPIMITLKKIFNFQPE